MLDVKNTCRTCMKEDDNLVDLYEPLNFGKDSKILIAQALMECTATQVAKLDGLPQCLCQVCAQSLRLSYSFRHQALETDIKLRNIVFLETIKHEDSIMKSESDQDLQFKSEDIPSETYVVELDFMKEESNVDSSSSVFDQFPTNSPFECKLCSKAFRCEKKLRKHERLHEEGGVKCHVCYKLFHKQSSLQRHLAKHPELEHNHGCTYCGQLFSDDADLLLHMLDHRKDMPVDVKTEDKNQDTYKCTECDIGFSKPRALTSHLKKHKHMSVSYECDICGSIFSQKSLLTRHMKLHSIDKPLKCLLCPKSYTRPDQFKDHMRRHEGVKPNICPYCNKAFTQMCNLKDHIRTHTGETPFLCSKCGKGFNNGSNLRQHMLRHTGVKPFPCSLCPKMFGTKGQLSSHMDTHTGAHPYRCSECGASFTKPYSLKKHTRIHLGIKPFECDVCPMRFADKNHLKRHQRIHTGEKPYQCKFCNRAFTQSNDLTKHLRTHIGKNIYKCAVCGIGFRLQAELKQHYPLHYANGEMPTIHQTVQQNIAPDLAVNEQHVMKIGLPTDDHAMKIGLPTNEHVMKIGLPPNEHVMKIGLPPNEHVMKINTNIDGDKENNRDATITITFNPDLINKQGGIGSGFTIDMLPGKS